MRRATVAWTLTVLILGTGCAAATPVAETPPPAAPVAGESDAHPDGYGEGLADRVDTLPPAIAAHLPEARRIAATSIVIDTHIDVPFRLERGWVDVSEATEDGDFDYPRAVAGGLDAPFMSIYIPAEVDAADEGGELAERLIASVERLVEEDPDKFGLARSPAEVVENWRNGRISLPMGMENAGPIRDPAEVAHWHARGIRYASLAHSRSNALSDSSYDINEQWDGLSPLGREIVPALNRAGIMIDLSHVSDAAAYQILELTAVPVIASHSSARHFIPGFRRNPDDALIRAIAENGGVIQVNFGSTFISQASRRSGEVARMAFQAYLEESGVAFDSEEATAWREAYAAEHPFRRATLDEVLDHFDHIAGIAGIEHVGIGSDYDGVGDTLPVGLMDVAAYPHLVAGLLSRGYTEPEIRGILGGNLLRVWRSVEAYARGVE